ncbi:MAG: hypothetical protein ACOX2P_00790 [Bacillota bacterium]|jgi:hypothetical protein
MDRIIEAYIGEYASGKTEIAINRALELRSRGRDVKLVDLDLVEPFFTIRPIVNQLEEKGLDVISMDTRGVVGLGETGVLFCPEMKWALKNGGDVIFDVGYGVDGASALNLVEGASHEKSLRVFVVVNIARPMTGSLEAIMEFISTLGKVDGLINNSHLGKDSDIEIIQEGAVVVSQAARELGVPVIATTVAREFAGLVGTVDRMNNPIKIIDLFMQDAYW